MEIIAVIPARYASTRLPVKLMQDLGGKTVILNTYEATLKTKLFEDVFVVTDSDLIYNEIVSPNYTVMETFISVIQKRVVKVVLYPDRKIAATKLAAQN